MRNFKWHFYSKTAKLLLRGLFLAAAMLCLTSCQKQEARDAAAPEERAENPTETNTQTASGDSEASPSPPDSREPEQNETAGTAKSAPVAVADFYYRTLEAPLDNDPLAYDYAINTEWLYFLRSLFLSDTGNACISRIRIADGYEETTYISTDIYYTDALVSALLADEAGNCYVFWKPGVSIPEGEELYSLEKYDDTGTLVWHADYTAEELQGVGASLEKGTVTGDGRVFLYNHGKDGKVFAFGAEGSLDAVYTPRLNMLEGVAAAKEGAVYGYCISKGTPAFAKLGVDEGPCALTASLLPLQIYDGFEDGILLRDWQGMWKCNPETGKAVRLWSWDDDYVQIKGEDTHRVFRSAEGYTLLLPEQGSSGSYDVRPVVTFASISLQDPQDYPEKQELILSTLNSSQDWEDSRMDLMVRWYNRYSRKYKVRIVVKQLEVSLVAELMQGEGPDLFDLSYMYTRQLDKIGAFEELSPYYKSSSGINQEDILESVRKACTVNGKNVLVVPAFTLSVMAMRNPFPHEPWDNVSESRNAASELWNTLCESWNITQESWNVWKFLEMGKSTPLLMYQNSEEFLMYCMGWIQYGDHFLNYEKKECYFDSDEFRRILTECRDLPSYGSFTSNGTLDPDSLNSDYLFTNITLNRAAVYRTYPIVGYPGWNGAEYELRFASCFAMSSASKNKEGAWEFLEYLQSEEMQNRIFWSFPTRENCFERYLTDYYHVPQIIQFDYSAGEERISLIRQIVKDAKYDIWGEKYGPVWSIVTTEAKMYFAGDATLDATVEKIQNRVQLYLDENF